MYLGLNAYSHDSSACLIDKNGNVLAAVEEERFTQVKHETSFPVNSIKFCLKTAGIESTDLKGIAIGWKPSEMLFKWIFKEYLFTYHVPFSVIRRSFKK